MPSYFIIHQNGLFSIKRDRGGIDLKLLNQDSTKDIFRVESRKKEEALKLGMDMVFKLNQFRQQKSQDEQKGSTVSKSTEVTTEQKK